MTTEHTVKSFDEELKRLSDLVAQMGGLAEAQLQAAIEALVSRDAEQAARVVQNDARIDQLERQISTQTIRMLALRQPMARGSARDRRRASRSPATSSASAITRPMSPSAPSR